MLTKSLLVALTALSTVVLAQDHLVHHQPMTSFYPSKCDTSRANTQCTRVWASGLESDAYGNRYGAMKFDGIDDVVALAPSSTIDSLNALTIALWVKPYAVAGDQTILGNHSAAGGFELGISNGTFKFSYHTNGAWDSVSSNGIEADTWYHVVVSFKPSSHARIHVNYHETPTFIGDTSGIGSITASTNGFAIGCRATAAACTSHAFKGSLFNLYIFDRHHYGTYYRMFASDPSQVSAFHRLEFNTTDTPTCERAENGPGCASLTTTDIASDEFSNYGEALKFDGVDDGIVLNDSSGFRTDQLGSMSIEATAYVGEAHNGAIFSKRDTNTGYEMGIDSDGHFYLEIFTFGSAKTIRTSDPQKMNKWYHLVAVFDLLYDEYRFYLNGNEIGMETASATASNLYGLDDNNIPAAWGCRPDAVGCSSNYFKGTLSYGAVYDSTLEPKSVEILGKPYSPPVDDCPTQTASAQ